MSLRILVGVSSAPSKTGGISSYSKTLARTLQKLGHSISYLCPSNSDQDIDKNWFTEHKIEHFFVSEIASQIDEAHRTYNYILNKNFDLIINNDNSILQSLAPVVNCCFISICHMESRSIAALACANSAWCDYIVAISYDMHEAIVSKFNLDFTRVPIIFNGVSLNDVQPIKSTTSLESNRPLRSIFSGHFSKHKGADLFLNFLLSNSVPKNTEYYWFGDVPQKIASKLKNLPYVKHIGRVNHEEFINNLSRSDILIFPSRQEGCPMSVLEAMKFGAVPIVSDGKGAMRHLVTHGQDGFVCNFKNYSDNLSKLLERFQVDRNFLRLVSSSAQKTCISRFSIEATAERILSLAQQPSINRHSMPCTAKIFRWHRPGISLKDFKPTLKQRIFYRLGVLEYEGILEL